jgi:protein translocase SecG subunit
VYILFWVVLTLFVMVSLLLPWLILLQEPKRGGLGDAFGASGQDFAGMRGTAGGLHRLTIWVGTAWGLLALALAVVPRA